ncbi:MAG TPA: hypothetical protein PKK95_05130 [Vicinamibacterales bacterium]|nr:hypothetical protein [Vicinamibacterales bacterium]
MKRVRLAAALAVSALLLSTAAVSADVKMQQKTQVKFEGMLGRMMNLFGGKAAKEGIVQTVSVQGDRKATLSGDSGEIVDLAEEKVYQLNLKDKSYTVKTFAEIRREMEEAAQKAEKEARKSERDKDQPEMQVDFDVKESGQRKTINGFDCREVVTTITVHEKGKPLEQGGGIVMTANSWIAPNVPGAKELADFNLRYAKQMMGAANAQQMMQAFAMYPGMKEAMERFQSEQVNLEGTPIQTTVVLSAAGSPEQAQAAGREDSPRGGGGVMGGLMGRFGRKKADPSKDAGAGATPGRTTIMTSTTETLSIATAVDAAALQVPAGLKLKNK